MINTSNVPSTSPSQSNLSQSEIRPPSNFAPRVKEVLSSTFSGATYGAVSFAVRKHVSPEHLLTAVRTLAIPGCVTAAIVGGAAGVQIVKRYFGPSPSPSSQPQPQSQLQKVQYKEVIGGIVGACAFGGASAACASYFGFMATPEDMLELDALLKPVFAHLVATVASKTVQISGINLGFYETSKPDMPPVTRPRHPDLSDMRQAIRCLLDSLPRMSLLGIHNVTESWAGAIGIHAGVGLAGNSLAIGWDRLRGHWKWDEAYQAENRIVEKWSGDDFANKLSVSVGAALGAAPIAPAINDAGNVSAGWRPVVFAAIGCLIGAVFIGPAQTQFGNTSTASRADPHPDNGDISNINVPVNPPLAEEVHSDSDAPNNSNINVPVGTNLEEDLHSDTDASGNSNTNVTVISDADEVATHSPVEDTSPIADDDAKSIELEPM